ncbi:MAG: Tll0287-like domain-containing protein, partial [Oceanidesulfovibrio sp.]
MKSFSVFKHQSLQAKFLYGLAAIILVGGLIFAGATYYTLHDLLESEVAAKGELVLAQAEAVQDYVRQTLRPAMYDVLGDEDFLIEAMSSSYISRRIMENVGVSRDPFLYRRVAINARNPKSEASELELELIDYFRSNPDIKTWSGYKDINNVEHYLTAHPVVFQPSCLRCHGDPADSPHELIERYGDERGFGHVGGEVAGVTALALPVARSVSSIRGAAITFVSLAVGGAVFYFAVANLLFNRLVVHSLRRAADVFPRYFPDDKEAHNLTRPRLPSWSEPGDEIEEALGAMESLASHLAEARKELTLYATDLERMVGDRTEALSLEAGERRSDVALFVRLLELLNESRTRSELIRHTLPVVARRFH